MPFIMQFGSIVVDLLPTMLLSITENRLSVVAAVFLLEAQGLTKANQDVTPNLPSQMNSHDLLAAQQETLDRLEVPLVWQLAMAESISAVSQPTQVNTINLLARRMVMGDWVNEAMTTKLSRQITKPATVNAERIRLNNLWETNSPSTPIDAAQRYWQSVLHQGVLGGTFFMDAHPKRAVTAVIRTMYNL